MKELENEISKKNSTISELKVQLKEANDKQQSTQNIIIQLKEQVRSPFRSWIIEIIEYKFANVYGLTGGSPKKHSYRGYI